MFFDKVEFCFNPLTAGEWLELPTEKHKQRMHRCFNPLTAGEWLELKRIDFDVWFPHNRFNPLTAGEWLEYKVNGILKKLFDYGFQSSYCWRMAGIKIMSRNTELIEVSILLLLANGWNRFTEEPSIIEQERFNPLTAGEWLEYF